MLRYYRAAFKYGIFGILREVLRALHDGQNVEMRIVDAMMQRIRMSTNKMMEQVTLNTYRNVRAGMGFSAEPDLAPLRAMLSERQSYFDERLKKYRWLVKRFDNPSKKIGRRGHDVIREISLDTLEEGFLRGNPTAFTSTELARKIVNKGTLFKSEEDALEALKGVQKDIINKIPLFNKDGELKFMLHTRAGGIYSGKFRAMDVERYADMVAFTTAGEANTAANIAQAGEIGTRIVKWNSTGKGVAFYRSIGDHRCANVDGAYASLEPDGTTINGVYYPYYKSESRLPGMFDTCHPYCRHRLSPVPEEALVDVVSASPETHSEIEKRIQKQTSGNIDISRLDTVGQRSLSNVLEDIYERYPNLPKLESVVATNRHLSDENGAPIFASMDNKELKIYAGAQDNDNLRRILKRENRDLKAINGRTAHHYESIDDVIRHEFGHYIAESNNMIGGNYTIFTGMVENAGLMSHIMTNKNEFFPELFLLFEKGVLAEKLPIVDAHMRQLLTRIFG